MTWVWGVDPAVARVAFAHADMHTQRIHATLAQHKTTALEGERLALLADLVRRHAEDTAVVHPPSVVFVEQPSGKFQSPQLLYATGVIQAALFEELQVPVWTIPSGKWKRTALGYGNASKEQVAAWITAHNWHAGTQDEADAIAIAHAGRLMMQTGRWDIGEAA